MASYQTSDKPLPEPGFNDSNIYMPKFTTKYWLDLLQILMRNEAHIMLITVKLCAVPWYD